MVVFVVLIVEVIATDFWRLADGRPVERVECLNVSMERCMRVSTERHIHSRTLEKPPIIWRIIFRVHIVRIPLPLITTRRRIPSQRGHHHRPINRGTRTPGRGAGRAKRPPTTRGCRVEGDERWACACRHRFGEWR